MSTETALQNKVEEKAMEYIPLGCQDRIRLTVKIIQNLVAVPTRTGKTCSEKEAMKAMMEMQAQRLNPFKKDCYLVGYDSADGVATFTLITAHQVFLERGELHPDFDGMESGVVLLRDDGKLEDREGDFHLPEETVVGGWARVHSKKRKFPVYRRLSLKTMLAQITGGGSRRASPFWANNPAGQIVKCAEADALRSAFPTVIGGLVSRDETDILPNGNREAHELPKLQEQVGSSSTTTAAVDAEVVPESVSEPAKSKPSKAASPAEELKERVIGEGFTLAQFNAWALESGQIEQEQESFEKLDPATARRLLRGWRLMKEGLEALRAAQSNPQEGA